MRTFPSMLPEGGTRQWYVTVWWVDNLQQQQGWRKEATDADDDIYVGTVRVSVGTALTEARATCGHVGKWDGQ